MDKVLILNASKVLGNSQGKLNDYLTEVAKKTLEGLSLKLFKTMHGDEFHLQKLTL